jgi:hypothetical protein
MNEKKAGEIENSHQVPPPRWRGGNWSARRQQETEAASVAAASAEAQPWRGGRWSAHYFQQASAAAEVQPAAAAAANVGQLHQVTYGRFPLLAYADDDFAVQVHIEGQRTLTTFQASQCLFSAYHTHCPQLAASLAGHEGYAVVPIYINAMEVTAENMAAMFALPQNGGFGCDVQSLVTGKAFHGEPAKAACCREIYEEIGLAVTECTRVHREGKFSFFTSELSSRPPRQQAAAAGTEDVNNRICCVPIVADPTVLFARRRVQCGDQAGRAVAVIPLADYCRLLAAYNSR